MKKVGKFLLKAAGVVVVLVVALLGVAATKPSHFSVERSAKIAAKPETVFSHVNDLHKFQEWSPWAKMDPTMKSTFAGPQAGVGSSYHWVGNSQVGEGNMTITGSKSGQLVHIKLEFIKPFQASNEVEFTFTPIGKETQVKWAMSGERNLMMKAFCMFMDMDKLVGGDFEKGLAGLKEISEKETKQS